MTDAVLAYRAELHGAAARRITRRRRQVALAAIAVVGLAISGVAVATSAFDLGSSAPQAVQDDFASYTPQLGYDPLPADAVLVAKEADVSLYATPNKQGTYCVTTSSPSKGKDMQDGGTCVSERIAAEPIVATLMGGSRERETLGVGGKVTVAGAVRLRIVVQKGEVVERDLGRQGFFLAAFPDTLDHQRWGGKKVICTKRNWAPTFIALDADGNELARERITLIFVEGHKHSCGMAGLHSSHVFG